MTTKWNGKTSLWATWEYNKDIKIKAENLTKLHWEISHDYNLFNSRTCLFHYDILCAWWLSKEDVAIDKFESMVSKLLISHGFIYSIILIKSIDSNLKVTKMVKLHGIWFILLQNILIKYWKIVLLSHLFRELYWWN